MLDVTKPVQTRDGRKARIICTDRKGSNYPVIALVEDEDGLYESEQVYTWEGNFRIHQEGPMDLVNVPEEYILWGASVNEGLPPCILGKDLEILKASMISSYIYKQYLVKEILP